jgi:predicted kinase
MTSERPLLSVFSALPGTGKTTLSQALARHLHATYLRVDTIEQALRDLCAVDVQGEGYRLAYRVAVDNLRLGINVVADSCNPIELTRHEWDQVAATSNADLVNIEVICSNRGEHQQRLEARAPDVAGLVLLTWEEVVAREYDE